VLVVGLVLSGVLAGCSSPHNPTRPEVQRALRTSGYDAKDARCVTDRLFAILTPKELRAIASKGTEGVPSTKASDLANGLAECNASGVPATVPAAPPTSAATTTTTSSGGSSTPSTSVGGPSTRSAGN
jgi:hypothetical protein